MKLHYAKILLFSLTLNILEYNKNKSYITQHEPNITSRVLNECDIYRSIYDKDEDIKSVKEIFDRQTSQRFEEYEERIQEKRRKCKEKCDKDIQEIISNDKIQKSLEEKVEKVCLRCGCGLGGVAASVGLFGGLGIYGWKSTATAAAIEAAEKAAMVEATAKGLAAGAEAGKNAVIAGIKTEFGVLFLDGKELVSYFTATDYTNIKNITQAVFKQYEGICLSPFSGYGAGVDKSICNLVAQKSVAAQKIPGMIRGNAVSNNAVIQTQVSEIVTRAITHAADVKNTTTEEAISDAIKTSTAAVDAKYAIFQNAIIASVVALLIIVLVMIIIYLVLRYRRKKKMNKKAQYTKLLNQ
ncbi:rifin [Plasmodium sp. gorilla clade G1]|nr:rifin [Plasmodium sp. gorilla clade G1]